MTLLDPTVRAAFPGWTAQFEGRVAWPYCDVRGLVTVGLGCLIDPLGPSVLALPWQGGDIAMEWRRVKAIGAASLAAGKLPPSFPHYRGSVYLTEDAIDALALTRLDADVEQLARSFSAFASWPAPAQQATCSMAWAMGAGFPASWPRWSAAARAQDWTTCAADCAINATGNPGVIPRNRAQQALFLEAATSDGPPTPRMS